MSVIIDGTAGITTPSETNTGTLSVTGVTTLTGGLNAALPVLSGGTGVTTSTGTTNNVLSASPTFTGVPAAPTAASATNTTQLATTAFAYGTLSATTNGYTKLANGLIIQWGFAAQGGTTTTITFPIAFPTAVYSVVAQMRAGGANYQSAVLSAQSTTTATMIGDGSLGAGGGYNFIATGI